MYSPIHLICNFRKRDYENLYNIVFENSGKNVIITRDYNVRIFGE